MSRRRAGLALLGAITVAACTPDQVAAWWDWHKKEPDAAARYVVNEGWTTTTLPPTTTTLPRSTTTTRPARPATSSGSSGPVAATGTVNGYPCGGQLPPCRVLACESGGNPTAENPRSSASGLWQFLDSTWDGHGGYARASYAPPSVQNDKAAMLWAGGAGAGHWAACL